MQTTETGLVPERVEALEERARREIDEGLLPSCQFAIAKDGEAFQRMSLRLAVKVAFWCSTV